MTDNNDIVLYQVKSFINSDEYLFPGCFLINGDWGSGKTWFVLNKVIPEVNRFPNVKLTYITLFGLESIDAIYERLLFKQNESFVKAIKSTKKGVNFLAKIVPNLKFLSHVKISWKYLYEFSELTNNDLKIYFFDDVERISEKISYKELHAFLWSILELERPDRSSKVRVILISNDKEAFLNERDKYKSGKEKIIKKEILFSFSPDQMIKNILSKELKCREEYKKLMINKSNDWIHQLNAQNKRDIIRCLEILITIVNSINLDENLNDDCIEIIITSIVFNAIVVAYEYIVLLAREDKFNMKNVKGKFTAYNRYRVDKYNFSSRYSLVSDSGESKTTQKDFYDLFESKHLKDRNNLFFFNHVLDIIFFGIIDKTGIKNELIHYIQEVKNDIYQKSNPKSLDVIRKFREVENIDQLYTAINGIINELEKPTPSITLFELAIIENYLNHFSKIGILKDIHLDYINKIEKATNNLAQIEGEQIIKILDDYSFRSLPNGVVKDISIKKAEESRALKEERVINLFRNLNSSSIDEIINALEENRYKNFFQYCSISQFMVFLNNLEINKAREFALKFKARYSFSNVNDYYGHERKFFSDLAAEISNENQSSDPLKLILLSDFGFTVKGINENFDRALTSP